MPDADILRDRLTRNEMSVYEQICEDIDDREDLTRRFLEQLRRKIRRGGNGVIKLVQALVNELDGLPQEPLFRLQIDSQKVYEKLEKAARSFSIHTRIEQQSAEMAIEACCYAYDEWKEDLSPTAIRETEALYGYLLRQYESVEAKMLSQKNHPYGKSDQDLNDVLQDMKAMAIPTLQKWALSIVNRRDMKQLRLPSPISKQGGDLLEKLNTSLSI